MLKRIEGIRIFGLVVFAFLLMFTYAIVRPATESLFLEAHSKEGLPLVWLLVAAAMLLSVTFYNRVVQRYELIKLFGLSSLVAAFLFGVLIFLEKIHTPGVYYALYVLKDVYVIMLVEIYYSFANTVFPIKKARWLYGLFGLVAATGGVVGNLLIGRIAHQYGTVVGLYLVPLLLILGWILSVPFSRFAGAQYRQQNEKQSSNVWEAMKLTWNSSYLILILCLIGLLQIVSTLIDFQFNGAIQAAYPVLDERTAVIGKIYAIIDAGTFVLHALTGPILRLATVPFTLLAVPLMLGTSVGLYLFMPLFLTMAVAKVGNKLFDYSIYRAGKEILYIPLSYLEKTSGKSIVDMLTHRVSKGGASLLLMGLVALGLGEQVIWLTLALIVVWFFVTWLTVRRFRQKVSREEEIKSEKIGF